MLQVIKSDSRGISAIFFQGGGCGWFSDGRASFLSGGEGGDETCKFNLIGYRSDNLLKFCKHKVQGNSLMIIKCFMGQFFPKTAKQNF